ncbi:hypothetical protein EVAR_62478_1 [Eumeta japonica]|uniref:Uncharacterized protein n=1 Tax=Eumeta variegata TaxID=151549 RepID=A0A4C1ZGK7_EUMVA|nr:hypothetical protein EVAR_62478_1 [Eumeta japonica]
MLLSELYGYANLFDTSLKNVQILIAESPPTDRRRPYDCTLAINHRDTRPPLKMKSLAALERSSPTTDRTTPRQSVSSHAPVAPRASVAELYMRSDHGPRFVRNSIKIKHVHM